MAENRSNLVHALNISNPYSIANSDYVMICDSTELSESFEPDTTESRYICQDTSTTTITGYKISFDVDSEYNKDSRYIQYIGRHFINKPVGSAANSDYLRFLKTDLIFGTNNKYFGVRQPCTAAPNEIGGSSDEPLKMNITINSRGNSIPGYITITTTNDVPVFSFEEASTESPTIIDPANGAVKTSDTPTISGTGVANATVTVSSANGVIGTTTVQGNGVWSLTPSVPFANGQNTIIATQTVGSMNSIPSNKVTFTVDTTVITPLVAPTVISPEDEATVTVARPQIIGTGVVGAIVTVRNGTAANSPVIGIATVMSNGVWVVDTTVDLSNGEVTLTAYQERVLNTVAFASLNKEEITITVNVT